jgi:serine protease inhibitor
MELFYTVILWILIVIALSRLCKCIIYNTGLFAHCRNNVVDIDNEIVVNNNSVTDTECINCNNTFTHNECDIYSEPGAWIETTDCSESITCSDIDETEIKNINDIEKG